MLPGYMPIFSVDLIDIALAGAGVVVAAAAAILAVIHAIGLRRVRDRIEASQERMERNLEATEDLRQQTLAAIQLHEALVADKELTACVQHLSTEFSQVLMHNDPLLIELARNALETARERIRMSAHGHLQMNPDAFVDAASLASILLEATAQGDQFWASSLVNPEFWRRSSAYLQQQREKIEEGVEVHRVFVFDNHAAFDEELAQRQMRLQYDAKISVKYLIEPRVTPRDLVVVCKSGPDDIDHFNPWYSLDCHVGADKRIHHLDLRSAYEVQVTAVKSAWWTLQSIFDEATDFVPEPALAA
jgi:hypothetical protein